MFFKEQYNLERSKLSRDDYVFTYRWMILSILSDIFENRCLSIKTRYALLLPVSPHQSLPSFVIVRVMGQLGDIKLTSAPQNLA